MKQIALAGLLGLTFVPPTLAAEVMTEDVVVTASRIPQLRKAVIADVTVIEREEIERAGQTTFVELLQRQPGVEVAHNGGPGKASSIFIRGTNSSHVVVLVDGVRINSATLGTTAFENIPLAQIERVEILRGPATSLYGQDAIGGVIQIFTKRSSGSPRFNAAVGYGSFNTKTAEAGVGGKVGGTSFSLQTSSYDTDGFSALRTSNPNFKDDDAYRNVAISGLVSHQIVPGHDIALNFFHSEGHNQFDNRFNVFSANPAFSDSSESTQTSYALTSTNQLGVNWLSTLRLGEGRDESENFSVFGRSYFDTKQRQYSWQNDINLPLGTLTLLYDRLEQRVSSTTQYDKNHRNNDGYTASYLLNAGNHSLHASYRSDHNSQFGTNDTGGIGYGYSFNPHWRMTASYGTAFKVPTFNDLYFPGFGNPDLKPEKSRNIEAGIKYATASSSASVTVYENEIRDLIAISFAPFGVFNVDEARIQGITFAANHHFDAWQVGGSLDVQSPRDVNTDNLLIRRANRHATANLSRDWGNWHFGGEMVASSARYNDVANTQRLPSYAIFNLTTEYKINQDWKMQARLNNAFDKEYALAYDGDPSAGGFIYNTSGSNLFVGLRYSPLR
jgi:vitamin B12 transporter